MSGVPFALGCLYFVALFVVTALGVFVFAREARLWGILQDVPNARSSHERQTPRGAGIVFVWSALLTWVLVQLVYATSFLPGLIAGAGLVAAVSFIDDLRTLSIRVRIAIQVLAAAIFLAQIQLPDVLVDSFGVWSHAWWPCAILFIVAVTNMYNFMDGIDGLAALHSLVLLACWLIAFEPSISSPVQVFLCFSLAMPLFGFLLHNWQPARVFMGDVGSTFLGFTFACMTVIEVPGLPRSTNFFALVMLMMPLLFDATFTIATRFLNGEAWYLPHCRHLFQRLVRCGYSHATVSLAYGAITFYTGIVLALVCNDIVEWYAVAIPLFLLPYISLYIWVVRAEAEAALVSPATKTAYVFDSL